MAIKKTKKPENFEDEELLKSEVASFASSLGLASSVPSSGFDDSDFRKTGRMKPNKVAEPSQSPKDPNLKPPNNQNAPAKLKPKAKQSPFEKIDPFAVKVNSKQSKLPLMSATALSGQWYIDAEELEVKVLGKERGGMAVMGVEKLKGLVAEKKVLAERLLQQYKQEYHSSRKKNTDMVMVENAVRSGTTSDRVSALTCLVEDNPIANLNAIDTLLHMVTAKVGKRYAFTSFEALKELFLFRLLPEHKLKGLLQQPLDRLPESKDGYSLLLFWYWEENLKTRYEQFVVALEEASKDILPNLKDKALKLIYSLLKGKSEQERRLLSTLVNKLGDPVRKSASTAGYLLSCLLSAHPNMKAVVIDEVDSFIFRPHVGLQAKYHAVNFLSQILLSKTGDGPKVAKRLMDVYFALFKVLISETNDDHKVFTSKKGDRNFDKGKKKISKGMKGKLQSFNKTKKCPSDSGVEMDSRLLSALLTGVNRAFPYVANDEIDDLIEVQTPILFKLVHSKNFNVGVQALMLLYQISAKNQIASDRFYRALYTKLLIPAAMNSSKPEMFLGLLVKAMKNDINIKRIAAFAKRILQVSLQQQPQFACGCLFMLSEVLKARPSLWNLMTQNECGEEDIEHFEDIIEDSQYPTSNSRQSLVVNDDVNVEESFTSQEGKDLQALSTEKGCNKGGDGLPGEQTGAPNNKSSSLPAGYDPRQREPCYCNADRTGWWELTILASHAHPSVSTMARTLISGNHIVYNGDPLNDLSLVAFLDKFMEKKPKSNKKVDGSWHGGSQIAPSKKLDMSNQLIGEQILQLAEEDVPPEDVIFHKFYMNKSISSKKLKKKKASEDDEAADLLIGDDEGDGSDNEEIDNILGLGVDEEGKDYDYDDLDKFEDDEELLGNESDDGMDSLADLDLDKETNNDSDEDDDAPMEINSEELDIEEDVFDDSTQADSKKKRKGGNKKSKASPFASLEDYEHLLDDDDDGRARKKTKTDKRSNNPLKVKRKRKSSKNSD